MCGKNSQNAEEAMRYDDDKIFLMFLVPKLDEIWI